MYSWRCQTTFYLLLEMPNYIYILLEILNHNIYSWKGQASLDVLLETPGYIYVLLEVPGNADVYSWRSQTTIMHSWGARSDVWAIGVVRLHLLTSGDARLHLCTHEIACFISIIFWPHIFLKRRVHCPTSSAHFREIPRSVYGSKSPGR